jgi:hypothetical protein
MIISESELQAAEVMAQHPAALQLRLLQTVVEVAAEKNSTLMLPFPVERCASSNVPPPRPPRRSEQWPRRRTPVWRATQPGLTGGQQHAGRAGSGVDQAQVPRDLLPVLAGGVAEGVADQVQHAGLDHGSGATPW